jgi:hypothetical protein
LCASQILYGQLCKTFHARLLRDEESGDCGSPAFGQLGAMRARNFAGNTVRPQQAQQAGDLGGPAAGFAL